MVVPSKASIEASIAIYFEMFTTPNTNGKFINLKDAVEKRAFVNVCILNELY